MVRRQPSQNDRRRRQGGRNLARRGGRFTARRSFGRLSSAPGIWHARYANVNAEHADLAASACCDAARVGQSRWNDGGETALGMPEPYLDYDFSRISQERAHAHPHPIHPDRASRFSRSRAGACRRVPGPTRRDERTSRRRRAVRTLRSATSSRARSRKGMFPPAVLAADALSPPFG